MSESDKRSIPPLPYLNGEFLKSSEARLIRILSEYIEPATRLRRHRVRDTIVFFGSARSISPEAAANELELIKEETKLVSEISLEMHARLARAEQAARLARYYNDAMELARRVTEWSKSLTSSHHFIVCSGGSRGMMEAANRGASMARGQTIGLNIQLPMEQEVNQYVSRELVFNFHYFFMRKFWFVYPAKALVVFPGGFGTMDPDINSPRVQSWNVTVEQQIGTEWGVSASYLGSYSDRIWGQVALNPGVYLGEGPCVLNGVSYAVCSTDANLDVRRVLYMQNPQYGQYYGGLDDNTDVGYQRYRGLKLSAQRRSATGVNLNGSYTLGSCFGLPNQARFNQTSAGYLKPDDPEFDAGPCIQDRRHVATLTVGYLTPEMANATARALLSNWRLSGVVNARTGDRINIIDLRDNAKTGIRNQRPNRVKDDIYGAKTLNNFFDASAFSQAAIGTNGDLQQNAGVGPNFWAINLAVSKLVNVTETQRLELRLETFNLLNQFNWGNPDPNFNAGTFGRITTMAGEPRIFQFGVKYDF